MGICRKRTDCRENFYDGCPCFGAGTAWKIMVHRTPYGTVRGIITETEAYMGVEDKGSHTYMGRRTERTEPMFHIGGTSYVYFIYGMYNCMNITAGKRKFRRRLSSVRWNRRTKHPGKSWKNSGHRSCHTEKSSGTCRRTECRHSGQECKEQPAPDKGAQLPASVRKHLADGPGKLCIAMDITKKDNDVDMAESEDFFLTEGIEVEEAQIERAGGLALIMRKKPPITCGGLP